MTRRFRADAASMRPRPEAVENDLAFMSLSVGERGFNAATARRPWRTPAGGAVCGAAKSFNAATARRPWRTTKSSRAATWRTRLQCGHGPKTVENSSRRASSPLRRASMRPRPEDRGEPESADVLACAPRASMRPRPEDRGELGHEPGLLTPQEGFNAATARRPWRTRLAATGETTEMRSFNAATARRPWRTRRRRHHAYAAKSFNAATARRPWRTSGSGSGAVADWSFNAATARRPWRTLRRICSQGRSQGFDAATARRPWRTKTPRCSLARP